MQEFKNCGISKWNAIYYLIFIVDSHWKEGVSNNYYDVLIWFELNFEINLNYPFCHHASSFVSQYCHPNVFGNILIESAICIVYKDWMSDGFNLNYLIFLLIVGTSIFSLKYILVRESYDMCGNVERIVRSFSLWIFYNLNVSPSAFIKWKNISK